MKCCIVLEMQYDAAFQYEYRHVATVYTLQAGRENAKQALCSSVTDKLDGKLVNVSCDL